MQYVLYILVNLVLGIIQVLHLVQMEFSKVLFKIDKNDGKYEY